MKTVLAVSALRRKAEKAQSFYHFTTTDSGIAILKAGRLGNPGLGSSWVDNSLTLDPNLLWAGGGDDEDEDLKYGNVVFRLDAAKIRADFPEAQSPRLTGFHVGEKGKLTYVFDTEWDEPGEQEVRVNAYLDLRKFCTGVGYFTKSRDQLPPTGLLPRLRAAAKKAGVALYQAD